MAGGPTRTRGHGRHSGFTLAELLITVAIIAVLAGILLPIAVSAMRRAREAPCMENLRQLYVALSLYREDHGGDCPAGLFELVPTYTPREILLCPEDQWGGYADRRAVEGLEELGPGWPISAEAPTSYLYAGNFYLGDFSHKRWWEGLSAIPDAACLACWVHGDPIQTVHPTPYFNGRTIRLHLDGSVTTDRIVHFRWRSDGFECGYETEFNPQLPALEDRR